MILPTHIQKLLRHKSGLNLRLSSDIEALQIEIEKTTNEYLSVNTLKRLIGFIHDEREPRTSTLDIIAKYLGFDNWDILLNIYEKHKALEDIKNTINGCCFYIGEIIEVKYRKTQHITLQYTGNNIFHIVHSNNSELPEGNDIELNVINE